MRVGIFNNYKFTLSKETNPVGLRNMISYSDNIGNIVFIESMQRQLNADPINTYDFIKDYKVYEERYDILILSLANMISNSYKLSEEFISALEKTKLPICIFSIGIQVDNTDQILNLKISDNVKRILNLANKSGSTIGVRGEYTHDFLYNNGYKNIQVVGCPSLFYKKSIPQKVNDNPSSIIINGTFNGNWKEEMSRLLYFGVKYAKAYLIQNESRILVHKYKVSTETISEWVKDDNRKSYLNNTDYDYKYYLSKNIKDFNILKNWFTNNSVFYSDFDNWIESMSNYDMSLGFRFHGSVMTTLAGVPSLILVGDCRVEEFVNFHGLPNIKSKLLNEDITPKDIYNLIDYKLYSIRYNILKENYISFLRKNGLDFCL